MRFSIPQVYTVCQLKSPTDGAKISLIKTSPEGQKLSTKRPFRLLSALSGCKRPIQVCHFFCQLQTSRRWPKHAVAGNSKKAPEERARLLNKSLSLALSLRRAAGFAFVSVRPSQPSFLLRESKANSGLSQFSLCVPAPNRNASLSKQFFAVCLCWIEAKLNFH